MRNLYIFCQSMIMIFLLCSVSAAENWIKFFSNSVKYDFYYEKDSVAKPDKNALLIWYKSIPQKEAENKVWIEYLELREVDCSRRRYKRLQGRVTFENKNKPMEELRESSWIYLEANDLDNAFYDTACSKKSR